MNFFRRILATLLILSVLGLHFPKIILAGQSRLLTKAVGITEHLPEILALPEEEIPVEEVKKGKSRTWLWVLGNGIQLRNTPIQLRTYYIFIKNTIS